jgi:hypothetical protein
MFSKSGYIFRYSLPKDVRFKFKRNEIKIVLRDPLRFSDSLALVQNGLAIFLNSGIFLINKLMEIRKMPNQSDMLEQLRIGKVALAPVSLRLVETETVGRDSFFDAIVEVSWGDAVARFALECKTLSTPKAFRDGLNALKSAALPNGYGAMLFVPFLGDEQLQTLERENYSGIDLCGNGVVIAPEKFAIYRTGGENRFVSSAPIKNIYRKNSSMVARGFLAHSTYKTVQEVWAEINARNLLVRRWNKKAMGLSTVSKALKTLEEDLVVSRGEAIRLMQPDKLLQKLRENYVAPVVKSRVRLKVPQNPRPLTEILQEQALQAGMPFMASSLSSVGQYASMQRGEILSVCCPKLNPLIERLKGDSSDRFPNLELLEIDDETVYFDAQRIDDFWWASPVQVYLELMSGDKRDQETAEQVKAFIINTLELDQI